MFGFRRKGGHHRVRWCRRYRSFGLAYDSYDLGVESLGPGLRGNGCGLRLGEIARGFLVRSENRLGIRKFLRRRFVQRDRLPPEPLGVIGVRLRLTELPEPLGEAGPPAMMASRSTLPATRRQADLWREITEGAASHHGHGRRGTAAHDQQEHHGCAAPDHFAHDCMCKRMIGGRWGLAP
jgi:hypothetical protein